MLSKNSRASSYIAVRIAGVICGNFAVSNVLLCQAPEPEPLRAEAVEQRPRTAVAEHTLHLRCEHLRFVQLAAVRQRRQFRIGHRGPEEIRQARGEVMVVQGNDRLARLRRPSRA